ncbi:ATP-grasp fold amidoligase family protein [Halomonas sp. S2151]
MLACDKELSSPFPYVRVDSYIEKGRLLLGEMTFTLSANMDDGYSGKGLRYLGELLHLPDV